MSITATITGEAVQLTGNPVRIHCTGGSVPSGASEYKILLKVTSEDGKLEGAPFTDGIAPDSDGEAWFDIAGYVDAPVKAKFQYPISGAIVAHTTKTLNIQIQPGERYIDSNNELQEDWGTVSSVFQMLKGGLSPRQIAMMNDDETTFYDTYIAGNKWLTSRPSGDVVHPTQPVKLWYMINSTASSNYQVKTFYNDGTYSTYTIGITLYTDYLYEFNCNPVDLGIVLKPAGKHAVYFEVSLVGVSETRSFYFDWTYIERPIFMLFANSLGGVDDVYFSGFVTDKFSVEGDTVYHPPMRDDTVYDPTLHAPNKKGQNRWTVNTGWKSITTIQFYRDLLLSKQAWYIYSNISVTTYIVIPIIVAPGEKTLFDRQENQYALEIDFSEAHNSRFNFDNRMY